MATPIACYHAPIPVYFYTEHVSDIPSIPKEVHLSLVDGGYCKDVPCHHCTIGPNCGRHCTADWFAQLCPDIAATYPELFI